MKLAVFDFDSTLMDGESIDIFAKHYGVGDEVEKITHKAMKGEIDFFEALRARVALLKGMRLQEVEQIAHTFPIMQGAKACVSAFKGSGYKVVCLSGGFHIATDYIGEIIGLDECFANILHHKNGILSGEVGGEMLFGDAKGQILKRLQRILGIGPKDCVAVGDGANDVSMFKYAHVRVAFCAKDILKQCANVIVDIKDLREVANALNIPLVDK